MYNGDAESPSSKLIVAYVSAGKKLAPSCSLGDQKRREGRWKKETRERLYRREKKKEGREGREKREERGEIKDYSMYTG